MKKYKAIENNEGKIFLVIFNEENKVEYFYSGYEHLLGQLINDIVNLEEEYGTEEWEGNAKNPQKTYNNLISSKNTYEIVADNEGIYFERMGKAAYVEFAS